eukprot:scaffold247543_cov32-Tisochrysis_lutea.AAC.3
MPLDQEARVLCAHAPLSLAASVRSRLGDRLQLIVWLSPRRGTHRDSPFCSLGPASSANDGMNRVRQAARNWRRGHQPHEQNVQQHRQCEQHTQRSQQHQLEPDAAARVEAGAPAAQNVAHTHLRRVARRRARARRAR